MEDRLSDTQVERPTHEINEKSHVRADMEHEYLKVNLQTVPFYILITQHHIYVHFYNIFLSASNYRSRRRDRPNSQIK